MLNYPNEISPKNELQIKLLSFFDTGTMQTLDARHIELFLSEEYHDGSWEYDLLGSHDINKRADGAAGGIFDIEHLKDQSTSGIISSLFFRIHNLMFYIFVNSQVQ